MSILSFVFKRGGAVVLSAGLVVGGCARFNEPRAAAAVGDAVSDQGVFIGTKALTNRDGSSLGTFDLYAAPEDLKDARGKKLTLTLNGAVKHVAGLRNWHGHDGGNFENDSALYKALREGRYKGEWFIPPKDVLTVNLFENRNTGALKGTFTATSGSGDSHWYWSSTGQCDETLLSHMADFGCQNHVGTVSFWNGSDGWDHKDTVVSALRLVRAEPVEP